MQLSIPAIPYTLVWQTPALDAKFIDDKLSITAGPRTDLFNDPRGLLTIANTPRLMFRPEGTSCSAQR